MPFVAEQDLQTTIGSRSTGSALAEQRQLEQEESINKEEYSVSEVLSAGFQLSNSVASTVGPLREMDVDNSFDPDFNYVQEALNRGVSPDYLDLYAMADNMNQFNAIERRIDRENELRNVVAESGALGIAAVMAGAVLDPINFIPIAGTAYKVGRGGATIWEGAKATAIAGGLTTAASETVLQNTQLTRTAEESITTIAAGTFLSGLLGAGATAWSNGALSRFRPDRLKSIVEKDLQTLDRSTMEFPNEQVQDAVSRLDSASAARVPELSLTDEGIAITNKIFGAALKASTFSPSVRAALSPLKSVRQIGEQLAELPLIKNKNLIVIPKEANQEAYSTYSKAVENPITKEDWDNLILQSKYSNGEVKGLKDVPSEFRPIIQDIANKSEATATRQAVETHQKAYRAPLAMAKRALQGNYKAYKKVAKEGGEKTISFQKFSEAATRATARRDLGDNLDLPSTAKKYVSESAKAIKDHNEFMLSQAVDVGLFKQNDDGTIAGIMEDWIHRVYDINKMVSNPKPFKDAIKPYLRQQFDLAIEEARNAVRESTPGTTRYDEALEKLATKFSKDELDSYINDVANDIFNRIVGRDQITGFHDIKPITRGPLKERTLLVPDSQIEEFLVRDSDFLLERVNRIMSAEIELQRAFGTTNFNDIKNKVESEGLAARDALDKEREVALSKEGANKEKINELFGKKSRTLHKSTVNGIKDLSSLWDLIRGNYKASNLDPDSKLRRALTMSRTLNYMRMLGGVTISSLPDVGMPIVVHGFNRMFGNGVKPLINSFVNKDAKNFVKLSKSELKHMGNALDSYLHSRAESLYDFGDPYSGRTALERLSQNAGVSFSKYTGINMWNDFGKSMAGSIAQQRILDNALLGKLSQKETAFMTSAGIDDIMRGRIAKQFEQFGEETEFGKLSGIQNWTDKVAARMYKAAINKTVERTIITKGVGDVPTVANTEIGKTIFQFMNFAFAANQKLLLSSLQKADRDALAGISLMVTVGMATYAIKELEKGNTPSDNPLVWIQEGVDKSGILSMPMFLNELALEPFGVGLSNVTGQVPGKYFTRQAMLDALGPTADLGSGVYQSGRAIRDLAFGNEVTKGDIKTARKMLPYNNLIGIRWLFDEAQKGLEENIGTTKKEQRRTR